MGGVIIFWLIFSLIVGAIGNDRKIGFAGGFFLSILLSPLIGLIIVLVSDKKNRAQETKNSLSAKAVGKGNEGKYQEAIDLMHQSLQINGNDPNSHYNLACYYSRLNKIDLAFRHLSKAVELGYSNFEKIEKDEDLTNLRNTEKFAEFADKGYKI